MSMIIKEIMIMIPIVTKKEILKRNTISENTLFYELSTD